MAQRISVNYPTNGLVAEAHLQVYGQTAAGRGLHMKCYFLLRQKRLKKGAYILSFLTTCLKGTTYAKL